MSQQRPWDRLRAALHREPPAVGEGPSTLVGVTVGGFRSWAGGEGLAEREAEEGLVTVEGAHRLGAVRAYCLAGGEDGPVVGVDVAVTAAHAGAPPDLAAFLLQPVAPALEEPQHSALDTWLRGQLARGGPYQAATAVGGLQVAIGIDDANSRGRTWALTIRPA